VLARYFDFFLYFATWGARRLMFRFPTVLLDEDALAQLHAVEAAAPLTKLFRRIDENQDDFLSEDLPVAFGVLWQGRFPP
jgi:hypothetical protein